MKHDTQWLVDNVHCNHGSEYPPSESMPNDVAQEFCQLYQEHISRWRSLDDLPEDGIDVEVTAVTGKHPSRRRDFYTTPLPSYLFSGENYSDVFWRPAMPLPLNINEQS